ncbi:MAG: SGNH/GDSL hydrolase family protein [Prevotella sp.]|nr:SGNH/GDSL hydrolase family protein [Prevotella sp.]
MKRITTLLTLVLGMVVAMQAQTLKPFKAGDRVAFVGNSITDGGHYHSYIWLYYMTRFPEQRLWMMNCGIGGDTSTEILLRLQPDVIDRKPSVIFLTYGMNDAGMFELYADTADVWSEQRIALARENLHKMEQQLKALDDTRVVMIGTSPYDEKTRFNNNIFPRKAANITRMVGDQEQVARCNGWEFFNFNDLMTRYNDERQQQDSTFTLCGPDRIHPDNDGHMYMAYLVLKAQGMSSRPVADIRIDARRKAIERAENCTVDALEVSKDGGVAFDYLARSLPYPLDTIARGGMEFKRPQSRITDLVPDFQREMNAEMLCVTSMKKGCYELCIDDILIDTFTAEQLGEGINMADYMQTPQMQQARRLMTLNEDRWDMERRLRDWAWVEYDFFLKNGYRDVTTPEAHAYYEQERQTNWWVASRRDIYAKMENPAVVQACNDYMEDIVDAIYRLNRPQRHTITLNPVKTKQKETI